MTFVSLDQQALLSAKYFTGFKDPRIQVKNPKNGNVLKGRETK